MQQSLSRDSSKRGVSYEGLRFVALLALVYYLPVTLIWFDILPFSIRYYLLVTMTLGVVLYERARGRSLEELGFRRDTLRGSLLCNLVLSIVLACALFGLDAAGVIRHKEVEHWQGFYVFYVLVSSPFQEFLFRSVLFCEGRRAGISSAFGLVALSAVTYCFLHIIWRDTITLGITLLMGFVWGAIYTKYPNFWGVALSHAVLGLLSILVGLI